MKYVTIGKTDLRASRVGVGTGQFGTPAWGYGRSYDEGTLAELVHRALDLGVNIFDTAETYGEGLAEEILGRALKGHARDEYILVTKAAPWNLTLPRMLSAAKKSLERLQAKTIDLYLVHYPSPLTPMKAIADGLDHLVRGGIVRYVGVSNFNPLQIRLLRRHLHADIMANEIEYNYISRQSERATIPYCLGNDMTVIAYSPLAGGVLSQQFLAKPILDRARAFNFHARKSYLDRCVGAFEALRRIGVARGVTMTQVALAWLVGSGKIVAIPASLNVQQVEQNAESADLDLSKEELELLSSSLADEQLLSYFFDHFLIRPISWTRAALAHM